ncbi:FGGY family carbohydrate kinase [Verminephrobacter aporrectodeae]|uniref:FGGY family carbohydrate kinase n=1 Tax=Verminephrobacter aporrectodeae TaxID=1110389 RepID=UPI00223711BF|nr:FGGY family carbohydrate kinase [Verminephrobacter aporrectodeae]MCW5257953.1 hypothetical protein [Verminephrobacter aporrectodeae subsp. tuberculatae]MCW8175810.1 hypothetical protein [Verminephrobacter aporrectodeae subsp. tuberculatae]MCW8203479.1 hypothetical protein [Verminephrobacter aporrectodeae subsp. tuberculatae]
MNPSFAAIDQGTSSTRLLLASAGAAPQLPLALRNAPQHTPVPDGVEQAPLELLGKVEACLQAAGRVQAIGIANQGESCLAWDARSGEAARGRGQSAHRALGRPRRTR